MNVYICMCSIGVCAWWVRFVAQIPQSETGGGQTPVLPPAILGVSPPPGLV